ncbi:hypothetical protein ZWY2020_006655, partial [Hordeum vulgare]
QEVDEAKAAVRPQRMTTPTVPSFASRETCRKGVVDMDSIMGASNNSSCILLFDLSPSASG